MTSANVYIVKDKKNIFWVFYWDADVNTIRQEVYKALWLNMDDFMKSELINHLWTSISFDKMEHSKAFADLIYVLQFDEKIFEYAEQITDVNNWQIRCKEKKSLFI